MLTIFILGFILMIITIILLVMEKKSKVLIGVNAICFALVILTSILCYNDSKEFYKQRDKLKEIKNEIQTLEEKQKELSATFNVNLMTGKDLDKVGEYNQELNDIDTELHKLINIYNEQTVKCNDLLKENELPRLIK